MNEQLDLGEGLVIKKLELVMECLPDRSTKLDAMEFSSFIFGNLVAATEQVAQHIRATEAQAIGVLFSPHIVGLGEFGEAVEIVYHDVLCWMADVYNGADPVGYPAGMSTLELDVEVVRLTSSGYEQIAMESFPMETIFLLLYKVGLLPNVPKEHIFDFVPFIYC